MRFVVLHHTDWGEAHFDVMLERPEPAGGLMTFRAARYPIQPGDIVEQIADHRREYLTFQGPLTGGRGSVTQMVEGTYDVLLEMQSNAGQLCLRFKPAGGVATTELILGNKTPTMWIAQSALLGAGWVSSSIEK